MKLPLYWIISFSVIANVTSKENGGVPEERAGRRRNGLVCYSCSSVVGEKDPNCETNPVNKVECSKKYCVTKFVEYTKPGVGADYLRRSCEDDPPRLNGSVAGDGFTAHYQACTTDLCNDGQRIISRSNQSDIDSRWKTNCCNQRRCEVNGNRGVCMGSTACWSQNGIYVGNCPFSYGVCCKFEYSCGDVTSMNQFYFINPQSYTPYCNLRVDVTNPAVTQVRLDFKRFSLAQPNGGTAPSPTAFFCDKDRFTVSSSSSGSIGFQSLCGENTGQHIYVPVDATMGTASVQLNFQLSGSMTSNWEIIVTQIDCSSSETSELCAPSGCLQYYPSQSGSFESFNFNNGAGRYLGLLNYAMCFKRNNGACGIQYTADSFTLATDDLARPYDDQGCDVQGSGNEPSSRDYVLIPSGTTSNNIQASKFCGNSLSMANAVKSTAPGPFYMSFRTDDKRDPVATGEEKGFRFRYQEISFGC